MMDFDSYSLTQNDLIENLNVAREHFVSQMLKEGVISEEQATIMLEDYAILITKKGMLGRTLDKILNLKEGKLSFKTIKII